MRICFGVLLCFILAYGTCSAQDKDAALHYKSNVVDTFFGTPVADPYRWLESENSDSVNDWLSAQKKLTAAEKKKFGGRYFGVYNEMLDRAGTSWLNLNKSGPYYFRYINIVSYGHISTTNRAAILYYRTALEGTDLVAYDPNGYSAKDFYSISNFAASKDGKYLAVSLSKGGSDWQEVRVKNIPHDWDCSDKLYWVTNTPVTWWNEGFFYVRFQAPANGGSSLKTYSGQQLCYHKLGDKQESDVVLYAIPDIINSGFRYHVSSDNKYLVLETVIKHGGALNNVIAYKDLANGITDELKIALSIPQKSHCSFEFVDVINGKFAVLTNYNAPTYKVVLFDKDSLNHGTDLIMPFKERLESVYHFGHKLLGIYFNSGLYSAGIFGYDGELISRIAFDTGAYIHNFSGEPGDDDVVYFQNSFYTPNIAYKIDLKSSKVGLLGKTTVKFEPNVFTTTIVNYKSGDGTEIPMYLTYKKGLKLNGNNPVILDGYGGFGISRTPEFDFENVIFCDNGGILAMPLIRGGGEFGEAWHDAGKLLNKQNSFDDFIAAAEYLISKGYTNKEHLIAKGASNGGLLVGAIITQRPDLFKIALAHMGVYDMVRYHLFTGGRFWEKEYGISTDKTQFENLIKYSPLHNIKAGVDYPATLFFTASNDTRVPPLHTYKFLTQLQEKSSGLNPHIMYFEDEAGHNGPGNVEDYIRANAFELAFIFTQLNLPLLTNIR